MATDEKRTNTAEEHKQEMFDKIHKMAQAPAPLMIDEVALAYILNERVNSWEILGEEYGGRKIGQIYQFLVDLLETRIHDSMNFDKPALNFPQASGGAWGSTPVYLNPKDYTMSNDGYIGGTACGMNDVLRAKMEGLANEIKRNSKSRK